MAAGNFIAYDAFKSELGQATHDMDTHAFQMTLHTSAYTPNIATHATRSDLTNEVANAFGYTTNGITLASLTWSVASNTLTFDFATPVWTASGGSITARIAAIWNDTPTSPADPLVCYCALESGSDVTATDGNTLTININASGALTLGGATS